MNAKEREKIINNFDDLVYLLKQPEQWTTQIIQLLGNVNRAYGLNEYDRGYVHGLETALRIIMGEE